ncbi:GIY-YIG nuclease family protein [Heliophilum fasciatum]|uniref:Putative endonuclease n=1 Tax=Heliophilum fasciatum TaxID=35700 RepID=A0A4R2RP22_9FIRM|nr:GIY-YIG nuclease family protein [Heliophilum fasciatum]MCW2277604.1 putative endonuclease [Heliophilum fasciatum]TCP64953.1 putative endonuclease [Heliophilum fasciatum]
MVYTYIVRCADGTLYTGWTVDVPARMAAHNAGHGARYTRGRLPVTLVYTEEHPTRRQAQQREAAIKKLSRKAKEQLLQQTGETENDEKHKQFDCSKLT